MLGNLYIGILHQYFRNNMNYLHDNKLACLCDDTTLQKSTQFEHNYLKYHKNTLSKPLQELN